MFEKKKLCVVAKNVVTETEIYIKNQIIKMGTTKSTENYLQKDKR